MTVPTLILSTIVASRALRMQRPVPTTNDKVCLLRNIRFKTGDILLFHSNPFILTFGDGPWSHVAMVVVGASGVPRLFEITGSGECVARAKPLRPLLIKTLEKGDHVVAMRRITPAPDPQKILQFASDCIRRKEVYGHFYWVTTFDRIFGALFPINANRDSVGEGAHFCSSIIADALKAAKILGKESCSLEILPSDFGVENDRLVFREPYTMGPLIYIRMLV